MKIPLVSSDPKLLRAVTRVLNRANRAAGEPVRAKAGSGARPRARPKATPAAEVRFDLVPVQQQERATEYVNYQMPPLLVVNFSDPGIDAFALMRHIAEDPWLNHGGILALYTGNQTFERVNALPDGNVIIHLHHQDVERQLLPVLEILRANQHILMHRALQSNLIPTISGQFVLTQDLLLVPAYANLVANYLFNVGFVDAAGKARVSLVLSEMLTNAIEHGNCGIGFEEKRAHLRRQGSTDTLVARKCRDPAVRDRRVHYHYEIRSEGSRHVIRDEGDGFDWRAHLEHAVAAMDTLADHGRGVLLARRNVERMRYNDAGNEVTLEFRHRLSGAVIPRALRHSEVRECTPGDVILRQGEPSDSLYYVASGTYRVLVDGRHLATLTPADVLMGEMSMLLEETRSATVVAETPGRLLRIGHEDFIRIVKEQPYYGLFIAKLMARRLHRLGRGVLS